MENEEEMHPLRREYDQGPLHLALYRLKEYSGLIVVVGGAIWTIFFWVAQSSGYGIDRPVDEVAELRTIVFDQAERNSQIHATLGERIESARRDNDDNQRKLDFLVRYRCLELTRSERTVQAVCDLVAP